MKRAAPPLFVDALGFCYFVDRNASQLACISTGVTSASRHNYVTCHNVM